MKMKIRELINRLNLLECWPQPHPSLQKLKIGGNNYLENGQVESLSSINIIKFPTGSPYKIVENIHLASFISAHNYDYILNNYISNIIVISTRKYYIK